jgi:hypothetical protein
MTVDGDPRNTLAAPPDALARLTVTYEDVFGRTHASQFDLVEDPATAVRWAFHGFLPGITQDLAALAHERDQQIAQRRAAFLQADPDKMHGR